MQSVIITLSFQVYAYLHYKMTAFKSHGFFRLKLTKMIQKNSRDPTENLNNKSGTFF